VVGVGDRLLTLFLCGVDLIRGHSSHHPGPVEAFAGKLVLYGCGDCRAGLQPGGLLALRPGAS
jgi:poly-gamma-glutamate capsule biosynthesis protein CapA/YwtB (metallophosphatase superfamily)